MMPLNVNQLLTELANAKRGAPVAAKATPDEVEDAFEALDSMFSFNRWTGGLRVNPLSGLDPKNPAIQKLLAEFGRMVLGSQARVMRGPGGRWVPVDVDGELEKSGVRPNPCTWRWKKRTYWWGVRINLNHCAVEWLGGASTGAAGAVAAFGLAAWIGAVLLAIAATLKAFDVHGTGVFVYITWAGISWVTPRPAGAAQ
jgi:hypothetical protein